MGADKALLPWKGRPLALSIAEAVRDAAGTVTLVGAPGRYESLGLPVIADLFPDEGPLGGILTALAASQAEWNLITACDMPALDAAFLAGLFEAAQARKAKILAPVGDEGRTEPLCAIYHLDCRPALQQAFDAGIRKATAAFAGVPATLLPVEQVAHFQNVNTPEDWAAYARG
jgi:molybdopterin-guanine dinucleotide biosynthesis protein A